MEMEMIFLNVFNRSLAAGWLILAVIVVRFLLKKAPRRLSCVLWAVVAVRLLCPFFPASSFSLIPSGETISAEAVRFAPAPAIDSGIPALNEALNPMIGERFAPAPGTSVNPLYMGLFMSQDTKHLFSRNTGRQINLRPDNPQNKRRSYRITQPYIIRQRSP